MIELFIYELINLITIMETKNLFKIGAVSSLIQALFYIILVITLNFTPVEQIIGDMDQFVISYSVNPLPLIIVCLSFIVLGLLGLASVVPATVAIFSKKDSGWITIGKNIALLCLSVTTVYFVWFLATISERVTLYQSGDIVTKAVFNLATSMLQ